MTNKQAIDLIHACMHINNAEILDARNKACIALEKQEPKKVLNVENGISDIKFGNCSICNVEINDVSQNNFCGNCGQRLDWGEIK